MKQCFHEGFTGIELALSREWQRLVYVDEKIIKYCDENNIVTIKYTEATPIGI